VVVDAEEAQKAALTFVTWGSPKDALLEVMEMLTQEGIRTNLLQIVYMSPFHSREIGEILRSCKRTVGVEMNYEGQLCALIAEKTGYFVHDKILKYSGRQFTAHELYERVQGILK
jgi:2-oxoglutarate ferredoxin oxidoreductase subunit alpha